MIKTSIMKELKLTIEKLRVTIVAVVTFQSVTFLRLTFSRGQSMVNACSIDARTTEAVVHRCSESFSKESCKIYSKECLVELLRHSPSQTCTIEALATVEFFL